MADAVDLVEDYKIQATALKESGNNAYKANNWTLAIECYSQVRIVLCVATKFLTIGCVQAITIDPDDHVLYSNRSAAYMKADSKSKALWDAQKCVELQPEWPKGYSRLGKLIYPLARFPAQQQKTRCCIAWFATLRTSNGCIQARPRT